MDAIISIDDAQRVVLFNPAAERMFGIAVADALGTDLARFVPVRFRDAHRAHVRAFGETNVTRRAMGPLRPLMALRADGSEFPIEASISQVETSSGRTLTVILRDVSERVRAEQLLAEYTQELERSRADLRALSSTLRELRETERAHLAREVHDQLGQALTAINMGLDRLCQDLEALETTPTNVQANAEALAAMAKDTIEATRKVASELHPAVLDHLGLTAAVEWQVREFASRTGLEGVVDLEPSLEVPRDIELPLFRVLQEALANVVRHARARTAHVSLRRERDCLTLLIEDDGQGVRPSSGDTGGLGLIGMRERLMDFGGTVALSTRPTGTGARLAATVPWPIVRREAR